MQSLLERLRYTKYLHHYTRLSTFLFVIRSYHKSVTNEKKEGREVARLHTESDGGVGGVDDEKNASFGNGLGVVPKE